jgi:hypothetical protein
MFCFRYVIVNTLRIGDDDDIDDNNGNNIRPDVTVLCGADKGAAFIDPVYKSHTEKQHISGTGFCNQEAVTAVQHHRYPISPCPLQGSSLTGLTEASLSSLYHRA